MEYRTRSQFRQIVESMTNGNWTQAAQQIVDYGFYAADLLKKAEALEFTEQHEAAAELYYNLVIAVEMATKLRGQQDA